MNIQSLINIYNTIFFLRLVFYLYDKFITLFFKMFIKRAANYEKQSKDDRHEQPIKPSFGRIG